MLQESVDEIERVDGLIGQLLGYARINASPATSLDVNGEIRATLRFLKGLHDSEHVNIEYENQQPNATICIGQQCFRQILLNLLQNACQAAGAGGTIRLLACATGSEAELAIHDSGPGIAPPSLSKIFEPFFSTRENGTGMGLAVVKRLVENAGGQISCCPSDQLSGMEFSLKFPIMKPADNGGNH
jgi:signal transduction histidine kinase